MPNTLLIVFAIVLSASLVISIVSLVRRIRHERENPAPPRTEEQKAYDRQTALIWGVIGVSFVLLLVVLYLITR